MNRRYFRLGPLTRVHIGSLGGCVYDLATGDMMRIATERARLLQRCAADEGIDELSPQDVAFLEAMVDRGLAAFHDRPCVAEPLVMGRNPYFESVMPMARVKAGSIELDTRCNLDCVFCREGDNSLFRRTGCKRWGLRDSRVQPEQWPVIVRQMAQLGVHRLMFTGGEPLLHREHFFELVQVARVAGIPEVILLTNGALIDPNTARLLAEQRVMVRVQILGASEESYRAVTGVSGVFGAVVRGLRALEAAGVMHTLSFMVSSMNEHEVSFAGDAFDQAGVHAPLAFEHLFQHPANEHFPSSQGQTMLDYQSRLTRVGLERYCEASRSHVCFGSQVAVTADGLVLPCPMARAMPVGDWLELGSVARAVQSKDSERYRTTTKDRIPGCSECELRFGCDDCRPLEASLSGDVNGMATCSRLRDVTPSASAGEVRL